MSQIKSLVIVASNLRLGQVMNKIYNTKLPIFKNLIIIKR